MSSNQICYTLSRLKWEGRKTTRMRLTRKRASYKLIAKGKKKTIRYIAGHTIPTGRILSLDTLTLRQKRKKKHTSLKANKKNLRIIIFYSFCCFYFFRCLFRRPANNRDRCHERCVSSPKVSASPFKYSYIIGGGTLQHSIIDYSFKTKIYSVKGQGVVPPSIYSLNFPFKSCRHFKK